MMAACALMRAGRTLRDADCAGEGGQMSTRRAYQIAANRLTIDIGSVLDIPAEVVVSSDDYVLSMGGGVSAAIRTAAGTAVVLDAAKAVPREAGDVVVTTAGALPSRYIFHVVTIGPRQPEDLNAVAEVVQRATRSGLELMQPLGVHSIVFPALGTGTAGYPIESSAAAMAEVINDVLSQSRWPLDVSIMLMSRTLASPMEYLAFYEEFARRVPHVAAQETKQPETAQADLAKPVTSDLLNLEQERQTLEQELIDLRSGNGDHAREAELRVALERNTDQRLRAAQQSRRGKAASVFVSYAHEDEGMRKKLYDHLGGLRNGGYIKDWSDGQIVPGHEWEPEIMRRLDEADIILLLVTASFLGSEFIGKVELTKALERHRRGEAIVIPVILKPADWQSTDLAGLKALPKDGKAVSTWPDHDAAYVDIAQGLRRSIETWRASQQ
jgi:O-acetyl-ADP-ribose deacetylase (regulator of RNase III)